MKNKIVAISALAAAVVIGTGAFTYEANAQTVPGSAVGQHSNRHVERHPELRASLKALMRADQDLRKGAHDFDGHREKALDLTDQAIKEVKLAIASDRH